MNQYYVPPPSAIDPNLAPLLPPFVMQTVTEMGITALESYIPKFLTEGCLIAQRKHICSLAFMKPYETDVLLLYIGNTVTIPSYPWFDLCDNYVNECSYLISVAPVLGANCSTKVNGADLYPKETEVLVDCNVFFI